jgi:LysM repeat protein
MAIQDVTLYQREDDPSKYQLKVVEQSPRTEFGQTVNVFDLTPEQFSQFAGMGISTQKSGTTSYQATQGGQSGAMDTASLLNLLQGYAKSDPFPMSPNYGSKELGTGNWKGYTPTQWTNLFSDISKINLAGLPTSGADIVNQQQAQEYASHLGQIQTSPGVWTPFTGQTTGQPGQTGTTTGTPPVQASQPTQYTIKSGDTLSTLAAKNNTTVAEIMKLNPQITDANKIYAGATLNLPGQQTGQIGAQPAQAGAQADPTQQQAQQQAQQQQIFDQINAELNKNQLGATSAITGGVVSAPPVPNLAQQYQTLFEQFGTDKLETEMGNVDKQIADLLALYDTAIVQEGQRLGSAATIRKRQDALSKERQIELNRLIGQKNVLVNQLNVKYGMIDTFMKMAQQTYQDARGNYEFEYNKSIQLQQLTAQTQDRETDNARASMNSIVNMMSNAGMTWNELDTNMQYSLYQMEMQAGLPMGTMQVFMQNKPQAKLMATKDGYDEQGNAITTFIYEDKNGMPGITYALKTGGVGKTTTTETKEAQQQNEIARVGNELTNQGQRDYVSSGYYNAVKAGSSLSSTEFDKRFSYLMKEESFITKNVITEQYGTKVIEEKAKELGYKKKTDELLDAIMAKVEYYRKQGLSDAEIVAKMQQIFESVKR